VGPTGYIRGERKGEKASERDLRGRTWACRGRLARTWKLILNYGVGVSDGVSGGGGFSDSGKEGACIMKKKGALWPRRYRSQKTRQ